MKKIKICIVWYRVLLPLLYGIGTAHSAQRNFYTDRFAHAIHTRLHTIFSQQEYPSIIYNNAARRYECFGVPIKVFIVNDPNQQFYGRCSFDDKALVITINQAKVNLPYVLEFVLRHELIHASEWRRLSASWSKVVQYRHSSFYDVRVLFFHYVAEHVADKGACLHPSTSIAMLEALRTNIHTAHPLMQIHPYVYNSRELPIVIRYDMFQLFSDFVRSVSNKDYKHQGYPHDFLKYFWIKEALAIKRGKIPFIPLYDQWGRVALDRELSVLRMCIQTHRPSTWGDDYILWSYMNTSFNGLVHMVQYGSGHVA